MYDKIYEIHLGHAGVGCSDDLCGTKRHIDVLRHILSFPNL